MVEPVELSTLANKPQATTPATVPAPEPVSASPASAPAGFFAGLRRQLVAIGLQMVMRSLARKYRWPVVRTDYATGSGWATTWELAPEVAQAALDAGGGAWLDAFRAARMMKN